MNFYNHQPCVKNNRKVFDCLTLGRTPSRTPPPLFIRHLPKPERTLQSPPNAKSSTLLNASENLQINQKQRHLSQNRRTLVVPKKSEVSLKKKVNPVEEDRKAKREKQKRKEETAKKYNQMSFQGKPISKKVTPLIQLTPLNQEEEQSKFFALQGHYDPVFHYCVKQIRVGFKTPHSEYVGLARKIVEAYREEYLDQFVRDQEYLTEAEIRTRFDSYVAALQVQNQLSIKFCTNLAVPACIQYSAQKSVVMVRQPVRYTAQHITGVFHHEIGTHFVRKAN